MIIPRPTTGRKIYYIDVGDLPNERIKKLLDSIKEEMRQKKLVPSTPSP